MELELHTFLQKESQEAKNYFSKEYMTSFYYKKCIKIYSTQNTNLQNNTQHDNEEYQGKRLITHRYTENNHSHIDSYHTLNIIHYRDM